MEIVVEVVDFLAQRTPDVRVAGEMEEQRRRAGLLRADDDEIRQHPGRGIPLSGQNNSDLLLVM